MDYTNPWTHNGSAVTDETIVGYCAFVYLITNTMNNRKYVGKKQLFFTKTRTLKGKKKREKVPSDWKTYYGSNKVLKEEVLRNGEDPFRREILYLCTTKGEASYYETYEHFIRHVLHTDEYYNDYIGCRINRNHLPKTELNNVVDNS